MLIRSRQPGVWARHTNPSFSIFFGNDPVDVPKEVAEVLLKNPNFEKADKKEVDG